MCKSNFCKDYNAIDILKFVLAVFVMIIHSGIDKTVISPILRTAVPLFFIISSYFFFSKIQRLSSDTEKKIALWKLVKRNLLLYLFWGVAQLPIIVFARHYYVNFFVVGLWNTIRDIVLGYAFTGSWYILSLVLGVIVLYFLSKRVSAHTLLILTLPFYLVCCIATNYREALPSDNIIVRFFDLYSRITLTEFNTSLPGALFWLSLGNYLATKNGKMALQKKMLYVLLFVAAAFIALERVLIVKYQWEFLDDCYFSLILLCPILFLIVKEMSVSVATRFRIRELSVIIFVVHGCVERVVGYALKAVFAESLALNIAKVAISFLLIICLGQVIIYLREKKGFSFLKYAF